MALWHVDATRVTKRGSPSAQSVIGTESISYDVQFIELGRDAAERNILWVRRRITKWTKALHGREEQAECPMMLCSWMIHDAGFGPVEVEGGWGRGELALLDLDPHPIRPRGSETTTVEWVHPGERSWYRCRMRPSASASRGEGSDRRVEWESVEPGLPLKDDWSTLTLESSTVIDPNGEVTSLERRATEEVHVAGVAEETTVESTLKAARLAGSGGSWVLNPGAEDRATACLAVRRFLERAAESRPTSRGPGGEGPARTSLQKEVFAYRRRAIAEGQEAEKFAKDQEALRVRLIGKPVGTLAGNWSDGGAALPAGARRLVLVYWADWCGPCCAELSHYSSHHDLFLAARVAILGVNREKDVERQVKRLKELKLVFPSLLSAGEMFTRVGIEGLPVTIMVGEDGRIVDVVHGFSKAGTKRLLAWVAAEETSASSRRR